MEKFTTGSDNPNDGNGEKRGRKYMLTNLDLSSEQAKTKHFPAVDIVKFICSFLVIAIHVQPFIDVNGYMNYGVTQYVARLAVPFFFVGGVLLLQKN